MKSKIDELLAAGEGYHLEFKEALDKTFLEEVCAFANSGGGKILIGVRDDGIIKGCVTDNRNRSSLQDILRELQPEDFGRKSVARNPLISSLLQRINFIEKVGTGINRIRDAVRINGKSTVDFSYNDFFTVTYYRGIKPQDKKLKTPEKSSQKSSQKIIEHMEAAPEITIQELAERLGISDRAVKKQIKLLKANGLISRIGPDKGGYWVVEKTDKIPEP